MTGEGLNGYLANTGRAGMIRMMPEHVNKYPFARPAALWYNNGNMPVALITGCSTGIGRASAQYLAARGWRVFATARRLESVSDLAGESIETLQLDVTDERSMSAAVAEAGARAGRIDALVNNAAYGFNAPLEMIPPTEMRRLLETNFVGAMRMIQLVAPIMRAQAAGRIVNISSVVGRIAVPFSGLYNASKFALEAASDALRVELRPWNIRVIVVEPGFTATAFHENSRRVSSPVRDRPDSPYYPFTQRARRLRSRVSGFSAEHVARVVHRALTARRPRARYAGTPDARLFLALIPLAPTWLKDWVFGRAL